MGFCIYLIAWLPNVAMADSLLLIIEGVQGDELANVQNSLTIYQLLEPEHIIDKLRKAEPSKLDDALSERRLRRMHTAAEAEIQAALQPFGYYRPTINSSLTQKEDLWTAIYDITLGTAVVVEDVSVQIDTLNESLKAQLEKPDKETLEKRIRVGERLLHQRYTQTKAQLLESAIDAGFLDARYSISELKIDPQAGQAFVNLVLETGEQYRFGDLEFDQSILRFDAIDLYIPFEKGDVFDTNKLITLQLALNDSGYFDQVEVTADRESASDLQIPIVVEAAASAPRQYTLGLGYGTDTGVRSKFGVEFRRINDRGHKVRTDLLLSEVKRSATATYEIPMGRAGADSLRFITQYEEERVGDGESERIVLGANYNDTWRGWQRRFYLNYSRENFQFGDNRRKVNFLIPGINLTYTKADNLLLPQSGYSWFIDVHGGTDAVISDTSFVQGRIVGQRVWSPSERMRVLLRAEYGATNVNEFDLLPANERFFAGGDRSIRGFKYQSIGPNDDDGNVIGGTHLATGSLEVDYLVYKDIGGALFTDVGDAATSNDFEFERSVGAGLRWRSPVGMFRLDVGKPLTSDIGVRLHISIGADL